jgi:hypothetical protein
MPTTPGACTISYELPWMNGIIDSGKPSRNAPIEQAEVLGAVERTIAETAGHSSPGVDGRASRRRRVAASRLAVIGGIWPSGGIDDQPGTTGLRDFQRVAGTAAVPHLLPAR